jgi:P4 family phage/plasmid primase-like protien
LSINAQEFLKAVPGPEKVDALDGQPQGCGSTAAIGGSLDEHATEAQLAALLKAQLPPLRCVGPDWYIYENGVWKRVSKELFRPTALAVQNARARTDRKATNVLSHLEGEAQVNEASFSSFHKFDGAAVLINCANGVLRITANQIRLLPHREDYFFTGQIVARYDAKSEASTFERVLEQALPDPEDLRLFRIFLGYILFPDCRYESVLVSYGDTGTGKSTLAEGVRAVLGKDLVRALSLVQICDPKTFHLSQLRNVALNLSTELNALPILDANNFKLLASGELISADRKNREMITFTSTCKHWFLSNHLPRFQHGTDAELRRLRFLRFGRKPTSPDRSLKQKIVAEIDGIFWLMVCGLQELLKCEHIPEGSAEAKETKQRFKIVNNPIAAFIASRCRLDPAAEVFKDDLTTSFLSFLEEVGLPAPKDTAHFYRELYNHYAGVEESRPRINGNQIKKIKGLALNDE